MNRKKQLINEIADLIVGKMLNENASDLRAWGIEQGKSGRLLDMLESDPRSRREYDSVFQTHMDTAQETAQVRSLQKLVLKLAFALGFDGATPETLDCHHSGTDGTDTCDFYVKFEHPNVEDLMVAMTHHDNLFIPLDHNNITSLDRLMSYCQSMNLSVDPRAAIATFAEISNAIQEIKGYYEEGYNDPS